VPVELKPPKVTLFLDHWVYRSMPEYAYTLPTGQTLGKMWRGKFEWMQASMFSHFTERHAHMTHFKVELREGPPPANYQPPDWSNFKHWRQLRALGEL
jgi:hypothetical protein